MAFAVELEEWVGAHWHRFITRHASGEFEAARVTLESMRRPLGMLFRALGGAPGVALEATPARRLLLRRTWLQRVAGGGGGGAGGGGGGGARRPPGGQPGADERARG
ncbi:hypothetical protein OFL38_04305, partial [Pseudomonas aeruginosa]|nr:hypothetical protein [Pseudomonas aeruginosa]